MTHARNQKPEKPPRSAPAPEAPRDPQSVTLWTESGTGSGPLLPDLLVALNLASTAASMAGGAVQLARMCADRTVPAGRPKTFAERELNGRAGRPPVGVTGPPERLLELLLLNLAALRREAPHFGLVKAVSNELTCASEPGARFGSANAHRAAIWYGLRVLMVSSEAGDPAGYARCLIDPSARTDPAALTANVRAVAAALAQWEDWPEDGYAISVQCEIEACRADAARKSRKG